MINVFGSIKSKIVNIKNDLKEGLLKPIKEKPPSERVLQAPEGINAGGYLLEHFQEQWKSLHEISEENDLQADKVGVELQAAHDKLQQHSDQLAALHTQMATLPDVIALVQASCAVVGQLSAVCRDVEAALDGLEDRVERQEVGREEAAAAARVQQYSAHRRAQILHMKRTLSEEHAACVRARAEEEKRQLQEREKVFDEAFKRDVDYFKTHGRPEEHLGRPSGEAEGDLADIGPEEDTGELDSFLQGVTSENTTEDPSKDEDIKATSGDDEEETMTKTEDDDEKERGTEEIDKTGDGGETKEDGAEEHREEAGTQTKGSAKVEGEEIEENIELSEKEETGEGAKEKVDIVESDDH